MNEFVKNMLSGRAPESVTRVVVLLSVVNINALLWYAIIKSKEVPHIALLLPFLTALLGWKQWNERKELENVAPTNQPAGN